MKNSEFAQKLCARQPNIKLFTKNIDFLVAFFKWQQKCGNKKCKGRNNYENQNES